MPFLGQLLPERAHDARPADVLLRVGRHHAEMFLHRLETLVDQRAEHGHDDRQQHHRQHGDGRQSRADAQHEDEGKNPARDGVAEVHDGRAGDHADRRQVVGQSRHQVTGAVPAEESGVERHQMSEHCVPQVVLHIATECVQNVPHLEPQHARDERNADHRAGNQPQVTRWGARLEVVHRAPEQPRNRARDGA